jgi:DNA-binding beta-propeller fold protein YncE
LYQSNIISKEITRIAPDGAKTTITTDSLFSPVGVTVNDDNSLIVCNCGNNTLRKVNPDGTSSLYAKSELLKCPNGITMDDDGHYYVSNFYDSSVVKVTPAGDVSVLAKIPGNNNGHINYRDGYLYVVARAAHQIYRVSLTGKVELFAGSGKRGRTDGDRLKASFNFPNDLDFSPDGKFLYVNEEADTLSDPRILTPSVVRRIRME